MPSHHQIMEAPAAGGTNVDPAMQSVSVPASHYKHHQIMGAPEAPTWSTSGRHLLHILMLVHQGVSPVVAYTASHWPHKLNHLLYNQSAMAPFRVVACTVLVLLRCSSFGLHQLGIDKTSHGHYTTRLSHGPRTAGKSAESETNNQQASMQNPPKS